MVWIILAIIFLFYILCFIFLLIDMTLKILLGKKQSDKKLKLSLRFGMSLKKITQRKLKNLLK